MATFSAVAGNPLKIVQLTPGAGGMYCGNCLRDNALVASLRRQGHAVTMLPLYLPLKTDEADQSQGAPVFFGGINVYLEQQAALFRRLPKWLHDALSSPRLLRWIGTAAAGTRPEKVGELTVSMLRGEEGNQAREIDELVAWLKKDGRPDVISFSNALLVGAARVLKRELNCVTAVTLQGEDTFLDALPVQNRRSAWEILAQRLSEADLLIAPSRYYANRMSERTGIASSRIQIVPNGINLKGWEPAPAPPAVPVLGYLARMCPEKGLDLLVDAFLSIRRSAKVPNLRLHIAGSLGPTDEPFVNGLKQRLHAAGVMGDVEFQPNLDHLAKQAFFRRLTVFSVPAHYGEAFGLYLVEAMAAGVPIVQPSTGAFPEILESTGAGLLAKAHDAEDLARRIEEVLLDPQLAARLGQAGRSAAVERLNNDAAATQIAQLFASARQPAGAVIA